jgi:chromosome segregation ATPase
LKLQLRQLTRELEREKEARARADRQLEQFAQFADQMTASFQKLEQRFEELAGQAVPAASVPATPPPVSPPAEESAAESP